MDTIKELKQIISEILDIDETEMGLDTYLIRDLNMESIDLLELSIAINSKFKLEIDEGKAFLKDLRFELRDVSKQGISQREHLLATYPHLDKSRIDDILKDLDGGPVLKLKDVVAYIDFLKK